MTKKSKKERKKRRLEIYPVLPEKSRGDKKVKRPLDKRDRSESCL